MFAQNYGHVKYWWFLATSHKKYLQEIYLTSDISYTAQRNSICSAVWYIVDMSVSASVGDINCIIYWKLGLLNETVEEKISFSKNRMTKHRIDPKLKYIWSLNGFCLNLLCIFSWLLFVSSCSLYKINWFVMYMKSCPHNIQI